MMLPQDIPPGMARRVTAPANTIVECGGHGYATWSRPCDGMGSSGLVVSPDVSCFCLRSISITAISLQRFISPSRKSLLSASLAASICLFLRLRLAAADYPSEDAAEELAAVSACFP